MKFNTINMEDALDKLIDYRGKTPKKSEIGIVTLSAKSVKNNYIDYSQCYYISEEEYKKFMVRGFPKKGDILLTTEAPLGMVARLDRDDVAIAQRLLILRGKKDVLDNDYLLYYLQSPFGQASLRARETGTTVTGIKQAEFRKMEIKIPDYENQKKISGILKSIDKKIKLNNEINNNLLEQVLAIYRYRFVDTTNELRQTCRADEYFDISIGKTPPRKEPQWFSTNPKDVTWVSISDMGTCGLYISKSSKQLTREAVDHHNVKIVPDNTILLSFKLTVGRIAITDGEMTTNEAIAHFKTNKKEINEYLYCYLKCFNYQTMGSTSSIATAVNSKIIKGMPFVVPTNEEITEFHSLAAPMFAKIKANQAEISNLTKLRDTLLPKLISGELDVSDIDI
jgi:type I restriction enzyme S subunit